MSVAKNHLSAQAQDPTPKGKTLTPKDDTQVLR